MRRAIRVIEKSAVRSPTRATVTLNFEDRFRRRVRLKDDVGEPFLLDLPHATRFEDGDGLELDNGDIISVCAAEEDVLDISGKNQPHTTRLAWHIGNRHTPVEVLANGHLRIQYDHVLVRMLEGLGATISRLKAPFVPEPGAYTSTFKENPSHEHGHVRTG